ncbi:MAG: ABC transporter permease [Solirubrobacteraceae bacterium]
MTVSAELTAPRRLHVPKFLGLWSGRVGLFISVVILLVVFVGPLVSPYPPTRIVAPPFLSPNARFPLGTDVLGRDVLSRLLCGGESVLLLGGLATLLAYVVGGTIGLAAGFSRGWLDGVLMRLMDVILAIPALLFLLELATGAGSGGLVAVIGVATIQVPGIARIIRAATLDVSVRGYVEAASARGERTTFILFREIAPNIAPTIVADGGTRLTVSILSIAALTFLGVGLQPPAANWALMMTENRPGLTFQPWAVIAPALALAAMTVGINLLADACARSLGRSASTIAPTA